MNEQDIAGIEAAVGVALPDHYRRFLRSTRGRCGTPRRSSPCGRCCTSRPEDIVRINKGLHDNPRMIEINEDSEPWPLNYFVVGTNGGGDYWMVDLNDPREAVWKYDSEAGGRIVPAEFQSWAEYMAAVDRDLQNPKKWR